MQRSQAKTDKNEYYGTDFIYNDDDFVFYLLSLLWHNTYIIEATEHSKNCIFSLLQFASLAAF